MFLNSQRGFYQKTITLANNAFTILGHLENISFCNPLLVLLYFTTIITIVRISWQIAILIGARPHWQLDITYVFMWKHDLLFYYWYTVNNCGILVTEKLIQNYLLKINRNQQFQSDHIYNWWGLLPCFCSVFSDHSN